MAASVFWWEGEDRLVRVLPDVVQLFAGAVEISLNRPLATKESAKGARSIFSDSSALTRDTGRSKPGKPYIAFSS
jgi:hypothetical protein